MRFKSASKGQTISEYGLIGALVLVASIAAFGLLGGTMKDIFLSMVPQAPTGNPVASMATPTMSNTTSTPSANPANSNVTPSVGTPSAPLANGSISALDPALLQPVSKTVMTTGVNGTTSLMSDGISVIAQQNLAAGTINQAQYDLLIALSNQGHQLAEIEGLIETASKNPGTVDPSLLSNIGGKNMQSDLAATPVTYNGQQMTVTDLWKMIGFKTSTTQDTTIVQADPLNSPYGAYPATQAFLDLYNQAKNAGALNNSTLNSLVTSLSSQILWLSESQSLAIGDINISSGNTSAGQLQSLEVSHVTTNDAIAICNQSSGQSNGTTCSPTTSVSP